LKFLISSKIKKSNVLKHLKKITKCFKTFEKNYQMLYNI
jgi:hypothetical protein